MSSEASEALVQKLVESFRTLLDEALIVAIASDHDLNQQSEYDAAQIILKGLAQDVTTEEATGFNLSGIAETVEETTDGLSTTETSNSHEAMSRTRDTDTSSSDMASSTSGTPYSVPKLTTFNNDSEKSNILQLQSLFTRLKEDDIKYSLTKAGGDFQAALDDLLNVQYLKSTGQEQKGIDGFFQPDEDVGAKKKKKNKKGKKPLAASGMPMVREGATSPDHVKEMKRQDEIAYLADRFNLPFGEVSEIYYRKRFASGATAVEILDQHISLGIEAQDDAGKKYAQELAQKYRNVPEEYMSTVVQVTGSITHWSDDIAALLSKHFAKNPWSQKLDINYTLTPLPQEDIEGFETGKAVVSRAARPVVSAPKSADPQAYAQARDSFHHYSRAKREAAASAAQLSRRGTSSPLYRQAAVVYHDLARENGRLAQQASSTSADLLVEQQSTANSIDLHGVYVQDGVRIARQKVQAWWSGLGEFRTEKARQHNFTVITGLGRHSAGGVSQLRQAVAAALLQDGWKMQVETGRFVVKGRR
ncbi:hypothetical protein QQX98_006559 [Neonectria punicea]|uniref:Smr domain-containing protein n=1 Tax=Neonectria punicea TaxID=979145 RepID=A0ABR1H0W4_9HYPO